MQTPKGLLIVNGGATVAFIALIDKAPKYTNLAASVVYFGGGAFFAVVTNAFAYFSQLAFGNHVDW